MTVDKLYRAVPFATLRESRGEVVILADNAVAALEKAKAVLGEGVAFDLCDGAETVLTYRPVQQWKAVRDDPPPV